MAVTGRQKLSEYDEADDATRAAGKRVNQAFLFLHVDSPMEELEELTDLDSELIDCVRNAAEDLRSVSSAATLPFQLTVNAVEQRRFDRILTAERIRNLKHVNPGENPSPEHDQQAFEIAKKEMKEFLDTKEGATFIRDAVVHEMDRSLSSHRVSYAAKELMVQTLISTWAVFEHFVGSFIVKWIDQDPKRSRAILSAPDLKTYLGKQVVDIDAIDDHGFDLSRSMGTVIFRGKRLDNLAILRSVLNALFQDELLREALGDDLWMLNQRRHLFVHKRGLVDQEYLQRTGDKVPVGERLNVSSEDIERYLTAVQKAVVAIVTAARNYI